MYGRDPSIPGSAEAAKQVLKDMQAITTWAAI